VPVLAEAFKHALARWVTGVTIVTARDGGRVHGMTVSAFTEVSLDPPLVLVCADRTSHTHPLIEAGGVFAVNVLALGQEALSRNFASKKDEHLRFEGLAYESGSTGAPLLAGALVHLDCRVVARHEGGDHVIYVGRVEDVRTREGEPLLYYRGRYGRFAV